MAAGVPPRARSDRWTRVGTHGRIRANQPRMMPGRLRRIRQMTAEEARWRTREFLATARDRVHFRIRRPEWPHTPSSSTASEVLQRLHEGPSSCVIEPRLAPVVREEILSRFPNAATDATVRGDRLLRGLHDLLGYRGLTFSDWHSDPVHRRRAPLAFWADVPYLCLLYT